MTFVLTRKPRPPLPMSSAEFTFVDDLAAAHRLAQDAAGDRDVMVMGGADIIGQYLRAGLIDEIHLQLVPVLLGAGTRFFADLGDPRIELEQVEVTRSPRVTHLRYRVVR